MASKLLTEFLGTFFLVLTIGMTVLVWSDNPLVGNTLAPIAIGAVLTVLVYMGGHVSGAHYNPAVTLAIWIRGKIPTGEVAPYMGAQVVGATLAAVAVAVIRDAPLQVMPAAETSAFEFFLLEFLFTFLLVLVILNVATSKGTEGNSFYGIAIGFTVLAGAFAAGPVSGGAFNPAVAIGPILIDLVLGDGASFGGLWIYLVATFAGGSAAAFAFRVMSPDDI